MAKEILCDFKIDTEPLLSEIKSWQSEIEEVGELFERLSNLHGKQLRINCETIKEGDKKYCYKLSSEKDF